MASWKQIFHNSVFDTQEKYDLVMNHIILQGTEGYIAPQKEARLLARHKLFEVRNYGHKPYLYFRFVGVPPWLSWETGEQIMDSREETIFFRVVPPSEIDEFLNTIYQDPSMGGAAGYKTMYRHIVSKMQCLGITERKVNNFIKKMGVSRQVSSVAKTYPMKSFRPKRPLEQFQMDTALAKVPSGFVKSLSDSQFTMVTLVDIFSKRLWVKRIPNTQRITIENFLLEVFYNGDIPKKLQVDNAAEYRTKKFEKFLDSFSIERIINPSYRPQSNGFVERAHKTIKTRLYSTILLDIQNGVKEITIGELDSRLLEVQYSLNEMRHSVTKLSAFQVHRGFYANSGIAETNSAISPLTDIAENVYAEHIETQKLIRERRYDIVREAIDKKARITEMKFQRTKGVKLNEGDFVKIALVVQGAKGYNNVAVVRPFTKGILEGELQTTAMQYLDRRFTVETWSRKLYTVKFVLRNGNSSRVYLHSADGIPVQRASEWQQSGIKYEDHFPEWSLEKIDQFV